MTASSDPFRGPDTDTRSPEEVEGTARTAATIGLISMGLCMLMLCTCYMSLPVGGILGVVAFILGRGVQASEPVGEARAYANVGVASGLTSMIFAGMLVLAFAAYIMLYVLLAFGVVLAEL